MIILQCQLYVYLHTINVPNPFITLSFSQEDHNNFQRRQCS